MHYNIYLLVYIILILISFNTCESIFNSTECINNRNIVYNNIQNELILQNSPISFQKLVKDITGLDIEEYIISSKLLLKYNTKSNILISFYTANIINNEFILFNTNSNSNSNARKNSNRNSNVQEVEIYLKETDEVTQNLDEIKESITNIFENSNSNSNKMKCMDEVIIKSSSSTSSSSILNTLNNGMSLYTKTNPLWPTTTTTTTVDDTDITKCITCTVTMGLLSPIILNYLVGDGFYHWCLNNTSNDEATCSTMAIDVALAMELPIIFISAIITMELCIYPFCVGNDHNNNNGNGNRFMDRYHNKDNKYLL